MSNRFGRGVTFAVLAVLVAGAALAAQQGPVRVGGAIKEPTRTKYVEPKYPPEAQKAKIQGNVFLEVIVGADGAVRSARVLRGIEMLDKAATDAVLQWAYTPTLLNGEPVEVIMTIVVNFKLPE